MTTLLAKLILILTGAWHLIGETVVSVDWQFAPLGVGMLWVGLVVAFVLPIVCYRRTAEGLPVRLRFVLGLIRGLAMLCLALMASGATAGILLSCSELPRLLLVLDDSPSMHLLQSETSRLEVASTTLKNSRLMKKLEAHFSVKTVRTSETTSVSGSDAPQDLAKALVRAASVAGDQPVRRILLVSDGVVTGDAPLARCESELPAPCSAIGIDVNDNLRDLILNELSTPPFVYQQDRSLVSVRLRSVGIGGEVSLRLVHVQASGEKELATVTVTLKSGEESSAVMEFKAPDAGLQHLYVQAQEQEGELTTRNNRQDFNLDVRPEKIRVLFIEGEPSWEYRYLKRAMESDPIVEFSGLVRLPGDEWFFQGKQKRADGKPVLAEPGKGIPITSSELEYFDVLILGDLERKLFEDFGRFQLIEDFVSVRGAGLATIGGMKVYGAGNYQGTALARMLPFNIQSSKKAQLVNRFQVRVTTQGLLHPAMQLEYDPARNRELWSQMPWVEGGNAVSSTKPGASLLMVHPDLSTSAGQRPIAAAGHYGRGRVFASALDGTWHWALARKESTNYHQRFWGLVARWLSNDPRNRGAIGELKLDSPIVEVARPGGFSITLRDDKGNPRMDGKVNYTIEFPGADSIYAEVRSDPAVPGRYGFEFTPRKSGTVRVKAVVDPDSDNRREVETAFHVSPSRIEFMNVKPDVEALRSLCEAAGGEFVPLSKLDELEIPDAPRMNRAEMRTVRLWQAPSLLAFLLLCLCYEWYVRKHRGLA